MNFKFNETQQQDYFCEYYNNFDTSVINQLYNFSIEWIDGKIDGEYISYDCIISTLKEDGVFPLDKLDAAAFLSKKIIFNINNLYHNSHDKLGFRIDVFTHLGLDALIGGKHSTKGVEQMDKEVIEAVRALLEKALQDVPESDGNRSFRLVAKKVASMLGEQLSVSPALPSLPASGELELEPSQALPPLTEAPLRWADRGKLGTDELPVSAIKDPILRQKLEASPELVEELRACPPNSANRFVEIVYKARMEAGQIYRIDLVGQQKTKTNQNPKKGLDKRLVDVLDDEGLSSCLLNKFDQTSKRLDEAKKAIGNLKLSSLLSAEFRRSSSR